jgi:tetratricopeptide (TPR) repeat protein
MMDDICGAETGLSSPDAALAWDRMVVAILAHGAAAPAHLGQVLKYHPDAALPLAAKGLFSLMLGRQEMGEIAQTAARSARFALDECGSAPARARSWVMALEEWLAGRPTGAIFHLEEALVRRPTDTLSMKASHAIRFMLGDAAGMRRSVERVLPAHGPDHPLRGYALGCLAFALEETGDYAAAEAAGRTGLAHAPDDAWGLHAVAHVHDMTHRPAAGIAQIDANATAWSHCNNFRFHVWWHKALLHLDLGEHDQVLALYDARIRGEKSDDFRDIANATSLLVRLELEGVEVGQRWGELADLSEARIEDGSLAFADLHYLLALTGDQRGDPARRLVARIAHSSSERTEQGRVFAHPGLAIAEGLAALGEGRHACGFDRLYTARAHLQAIGGSHAQRDVFERITVDAGIRAGRLDDAARVLDERIALRAGHADAFAESRMAQIALVRDEVAACAAQ